MVKPPGASYGPWPQNTVSQLVKEEGTAIISDLCGIDSLAHQTALDAGGVTVGVLGFGFNHLTPSNVVLYEQIPLKVGR